MCIPLPISRAAAIIARIVSSVCVSVACGVIIGRINPSSARFTESANTLFASISAIVRQRLEQFERALVRAAPFDDAARRAARCGVRMTRDEPGKQQLTPRIDPRDVARDPAFLDRDDLAAADTDGRVAQQHRRAATRHQ